MPLRGAKIAIVSVGINYRGQAGELRGCVNDSNNFLRYARTHFGRNIHYSQQLIDTLPKSSPYYPTRTKIQRALIRALKRCRRKGYTHFWFHYSGHGAQQRDRNRDERDRLDETLVPVDYRRRGMITDDWLLRRIINRVPPRSLFFGLIDACHSASMLDLRFHCNPINNNRIRSKVANRKASRRPRAMMISGCRDHRYSYDAWDSEYGPTGAMSVAFLRALRQNRKATVASIVRRMRADLRRRGYPQIPQLSCSRKLRGRERIFGIGTI